MRAACWARGRFLAAGDAGAEKRRPIPYASTVTAVELTPGKSDLVEWTGRSILRRDGVSGQVVWDALQVPDIRGPRGDVAAGLIWLARRIQREALVLPAPDLNGDGTRDLVWPFREEAAFLAVSGKDWKVLWTYRAELDGPGGPYAEGPSGPVPIRPSRIIGIPSQADLDADGIPDLIATLVFSESPLEVARRLPGKKPDVHYEPDLSRRIVLAISGRSSTRLWSHAIDPAFATMPTPLEQRPAAFVPGRKESTVAIVDGATWLGLDPATGRPRSGPIPLGFEPERPLQYADLDGDGEPEILALGPGPSPTQRTLSAFSIATGRPPWTATVNAIHEHPYDKSIRETWPLVVDLDGDGRSEVVVPDTGALDRTHRYVGVRLLDGPTGLPRWTRPMHPESKVIDGIVDVVEAPDLDRDGTRDIATTSRYAGRKPLAGSTGSIEAQQAYVNAISGKDGRPLWWWRIELPSERSTHLASPLWWGRGPDGWPLLAIPIGGQDPHRIPDPSPPSVLDFPTVHMLEASTGRVVHTLPGLGQVHGDDLDGDGLLDLWGEHEGDLRAFRGEGPEAWRALEMLDPARASYLETRGEFHPPADLDGDGIGDALTTMVIAPGAIAEPGDGQPHRHRPLRTRRPPPVESRAGRPPELVRSGPPRGSTACKPSPCRPATWTATARPTSSCMRVAVGLPASMLRRPATLPLLLLSGRTGRRLWTAGPLPLAFEAHGYSMVRWAEPRIVEPGAPPDILVRHDSPFLAARQDPAAANCAAAGSPGADLGTHGTHPLGCPRGRASIASVRLCSSPWNSTTSMATAFRKSSW